jgi:hypothetical protein
MIATDEELASAQQLAYAINDLFQGCSTDSICIALGTVLACCDVSDEDVRIYLSKIAMVAGMVRARENHETLGGSDEEDEDEETHIDNVIPFHKH